LVVPVVAVAFVVSAPDDRGAAESPEPPAIAQQAAVRELTVAGTEVVTVSEASVLSNTVEQAAHRAARAAGGTAATGRSASVGMTSVTRGGATVQAAPSGWLIPMGVTVLPADAIGRLMGLEISTPIARGDVVMGRTTADLRGARAGDVVSLVGANSSTVSFRIGLVADDAVIGGTEILMSDRQADQLGLDRRSRVVIWGFRSREAIGQALAQAGLVGRFETRIRRGWDPQDPDGTLGMASTKRKLGEFPYQVQSDGSVRIPRSWIEANISGAGRVSAFSGIPIRAACHVQVRPDIQAAIDDVVAAGLAWTIDVAVTNRYGGCFYPRFNRLTGSLGFLSRHTWGMALDVNTDTNAQGSTPTLDCRVVRIFREHGFAWGGNFTRPDGMHFEWVGEPRHELAYPSRYCPNVVPLESGGATPRERDVLFANDGLDGHG
jgi:hypothetical protein